MSNCLELSFQRTNISKSSIFVNSIYDGVKVFSSVRDTSNTGGQGGGETWMLVYGWTDVVSEPIELAAGGKKRNTVCIDRTFPVKQTGNTLREVRVQGKLRIVAEYEIPTWSTIDFPEGDGRRSYIQTADKSGPWTFSKVVLEVPIPCPHDADTPNCLSPAEIFSGEDDIHTIEPEPPPDIGTKPAYSPIFPIGRPTPPKP